MIVVNTKVGLNVGAFNVGSDDAIDGLLVIAIDGYNTPESSENFFFFIIITSLKKITFFKTPFHFLGYFNVDDNCRLILFIFKFSS